ncbi:MAG: hypothetical protein K0S63_336 [Gammaproteobacteria bacterium]|jgi:transcriptional regulator with XRE-family HTH domain|nr:hypothetical protein [Gammaproteobacteria bacterium]
MSITIEKDSPAARAARLIRLRNLANLTRKEISSRLGINLDTYIGWEVKRHGGLSVNGAEKIVVGIKKEGVVCTLDWLLYEIGSGPSLIPNFTKTEDETSIPLENNFSKEEKIIAEELLFFRKHYPKTIDFIVEDDGMEPHYEKGDYVAGVPFFKEDIKHCMLKPCIVKVEEGDLLLRIVRPGTKKNTFNLYCTNMETTVAYPILYDKKLISVTPVIWHRKKFN